MKNYDFYYTQDGSIGLYSYADDDVYHSKFGAVTEAWEKFVLPAGIDKILNQQKDINVLDVCYGIGYNTKALMSYVIYENKKYFTQENFLKKILKIFITKKNKKETKNTHNETICSNNTTNSNNSLLEYNETNDFKISNFNIDCLDINDELIKISPLLKTVLTPQEIFVKIVPKIFDCFDLYWSIKKKLAKCAFYFINKNKKDIIEILNLKFNDEMYDSFNNYKLHPFVNYIIINNLIKYYDNNYIDNNLQNFINNKENKKFFNNFLIKYAKLKQGFGYKLISKFNLSSFLHNIYYDHLSKRYKKAKFDLANKLFKLEFYVDDARHSILQLNKKYDFIFLDAFTYSKAPELWSVEFISELASRLSQKGLIITYSNSALVRNTFIENNLYVGKIYSPYNKKIIGTVAAKEKSMIKEPLSNYELGLCATKAGIPYRDPSLTRTREEILKYREYDFKTSDLMTSSQYIKRRLYSKGEDNNNE